MTTIRRLIALALLTTACSAPGRQASAAAIPEKDADGTVVSVKGTVEATWQGRTRALAQGEGVVADELVKTGPGAAVEIRLKRNGVIWSLRGNLSKVVKDSLAWNAPAVKTTEVLFSSIPDAAKVSAGRHLETEGASSKESVSAKSNETRRKTAADTREDAPAAKAPHETAAAPIVQPVPPAPGGGSGNGPSTKSNDKLDDLDTGSAGDVPHFPEPERARDVPSKKSGEKLGGKGTTNPPLAPAPQKTTTKSFGMTSNSATSSEEKVANADAPRLAQAAPMPWNVVDAGLLDATKLQSVLGSADLAACAAAGVVEMRFEITKDGTVGELAVTSATGEIAKSTVCVEEALRSLTFAAGSPGIVTVRFSR